MTDGSGKGRIHPKGPQVYDLQKVEPGDFETLAFLLAHAENGDVVVVRNKDEGLDARLRDPLGRLTLRGWQAKRYAPMKIHWKQCEESLESAVAFWRPLRVTFVFTHDLSASDQVSFQKKLAEAHSEIRVDWWGGTEVQRLLRDTEEGRRAAAWLFEGGPTIEDLMASLVSSEPVRTAAEIAERQLGLQERLDTDPHFYYTTVGRALGAPETDPAPGTVASVVLAIDGQEVRYDLQERYPGALEDLGGSPLLVVSDDERGEQARKAIDAALHATGPTRIERGAGVRWPAVPVGLRGLVPEAAWGAMEIGPASKGVLEHKPRAPLAFLARAGDASLGMAFVPADEPSPGYEVTLVAATGGLELLLFARAKPGKPFVPGNMDTRLDWRHTLGLGPALDQLLSCRLLLAVMDGDSLVLSSAEQPEAEMVGVAPDHFSEQEIAGLRRHEQFLRLVCELQAWLGRPLEPPARPTPEDAAELGRALSLIREPERRGTWREIRITLGQQPPDTFDVAVLEAVYVSLFGHRIYLGVDQIVLSAARVGERDGDDAQLVPVGEDGELVARLFHPDDASPEAARPRAAAGFGRVLVRPLSTEPDPDTSGTDTRDRPPLPGSFGRPDLEAVGFAGWQTWEELRASDFASQPHGPAAYVVYAPAGSDPVFLPESPAGLFRGKDPTVGVDVLEAEWIPGAGVIYIGQSNDAARRMKQFARFGAGELVGHWGGRYIWQLGNSSELLVAWHRISWAEEAREYEKRLLAHFRELHQGARPFANLIG